MSIDQQIESAMDQRDQARRARRSGVWLRWGLLGVSLGAHGVLLGVCANWLARPISVPLTVELVRRGNATRTNKEVPWAAPRTPPRVPRLGDRRPPWAAAAADALAEERDGGTATGQASARPRSVNTAGADLHRLRSRIFDHPSRDSAQRIVTRRWAVTHDNLRATPNPALRANLASGRGSAERRSEQWRRAARAVHRQGAYPWPQGGLAAALAAVGERRPRSGRRPHAPRAERWIRLPTAGLQAPAQQRPEVRRAVPASETRRRMPDVADNRERRQASTQRRPDRVDLAQASGRGKSSGRGRGSRAGRRGSPGGRWRGAALWLNTRDARYVDYFRQIHRRVQPLWRFPKRLEILMEQGDVLVEFVVGPDGGVERVRVRRSSGYPAFDRNAVAAIRRAAPFPAVPPQLGAPLTIVAPFEFANPLIR